MEFMARCGRCGALVEAERGTINCEPVYYVPCAVAARVGDDDRVVTSDCEYTVLCPDCVGQLKEWLAEAPKDKKEQVDESAGEDSVERLAADIVKAINNGMRCGVCQQAIACEYFGHGNYKPCLSGSVCRGYGDGTGGSESCCRAMLEDVLRRCEALGIDLAGAYDE